MVISRGKRARGNLSEMRAMAVDLKTCENMNVAWFGQGAVIASMGRVV